MSFNLEGIKPVFAYGKILYNPHDCPIPDHLKVHELVHMMRQKDPQAWWKLYLSDPQFRLTEELLAYRAQYDFAKQWIKDRNQLAQFLNMIATELSSAMYGNLIDKIEATKQIKA